MYANSLVYYLSENVAALSERLQIECVWFGSLCGDSQLYICFGLLLGKCAEEVDLLFAGWLPLVIRLKGAFKMRFYVHVECLWL